VQKISTLDVFGQLERGDAYISAEVTKKLLARNGDGRYECTL